MNHFQVREQQAFRRSLPKQQPLRSSNEVLEKRGRGRPRKTPEDQPIVPPMDHPLVPQDRTL